MVSSGISQGYFDDFKSIKKFGEKIARVLDADGPINRDAWNNQQNCNNKTAEIWPPLAPTLGEGLAPTLGEGQC